MGRPLRLLAVLAIGFVLATATSAAATATPPPTTIEDLNEQRKALYESELDSNLQRRKQPEQTQAQQTRAAVELFRSMERNFVPDPDIIGDVAAQPPARPVPDLPAPAVPHSGVGVVASLLLGLVGGVVGGCAALAGWAAATRRRPRRPASAT
jgi:hypothetical protein